jgi:hypothetical protein
MMVDQVCIIILSVFAGTLFVFSDGLGLFLFFHTIDRLLYDILQQLL